MNKPSLICRKTVDYRIEELPFDENHETIIIFNISNIRVIIPSRKHPIDIGSLAYCVREKQVIDCNNPESAEYLVAPGTLRKERFQQIHNYIESLYICFRVGKLRSATIYGQLKAAFAFFDWCDGNGHVYALCCVKQARKALAEYIALMEHKVRTNQMHVNTAATYQNIIIKVISIMFDMMEIDVYRGIRKLHLNTMSANSTKPPSIGDATKCLSILESLFDGIHDLVVNNRNFPHKIQLPSENVWLFPSAVWAATKEKLSTRDSWDVGRWAWDYEAGTIADPEDILFRYNEGSIPRNRNRAREAVKGAQKALHAANLDLRHKQRMQLADLAGHCFLMMFFANTGMNYAQAQHLTWSDTYDIETEVQGFRAVKNRAKGKTVEFIVTTIFIKKLEKYLSLRKFILGGQNFDFLFLTLDRHSSTLPRMISSGLSTRIYENLRHRLYSNLPKVTAREWRAYKSDYLIKNADISTTAMLLQNSEETTLKSYVEGSEIEHAGELSEFYRNLSKYVYSETNKEKHVASPAGHCSKANSPKPSIESPSIKPDCRTPEGCLFCENYAIHADEADVRKLLSLRYIIIETIPLAHSEAHHSEVFGGTIKRINSLLEVLKQRYAECSALIAEVTQDIEENENLDSYWGKKMAVLYDIGAL